MESNTLEISQLNKDWQKLKIRTDKAIKTNNISKAFEMLEGIGYFGYKYNFIPTFTDPEVDNLIKKLSKKIVSSRETSNELSNSKIVFYDFFIFENRGFTQQYLEHLTENNYEILFLTDDENKINEENSIIKSLIGYNKAQLAAPPKSSSKAEALVFLMNQISSFQAPKIFIHNAPWDIISCCLGYLSAVIGLKSYLLNITDHTYWPGKDCFTNFIDFRKYGYQLNNEIRGIEKSRLSIIPTPNYQDKKRTHDFKGFPIDIDNKIIGFSGGTFYKIVDEENTFLNLVKDILFQNPNFVFFFANIGGDDILNQFINKFKLENQFILLGNRTDIEALFENIHIYFNTYPYGGGLMLQYASRNNKPILAFLNKDLVHTRIDVVLDIPYNEDYVITNKDKYLNTANKLIRNNVYREEFVKYFQTPRDINEIFNEGLKGILNNIKQTEFIFKNKLKINTSAIAAFHIQNDILYTKEYRNLKAKYIPSDTQILKRKIKSLFYWFIKYYSCFKKTCIKFRTIKVASD